MKSILFKREVTSWALYDWANSAFSTTIVAGFFPVLYNSMTAQLSAGEAQFWFNIALAVSSAVVALLSPILGAIADFGGRRKRYLAAFASLGILMCLGLAWAVAGVWWMALIVYGLGQVGFAGANTFYDALLVEVSPDDEVDVVSGYGYALGYLGGGLLFLLNVLMVTQPAWFGFENVTTALAVSFASVGVWWFVFTIPLLAYVPETPVQSGLGVGQVIGQGFKRLKATAGEIRKLRTASLFLIGYWLYIDGVGTIYKMAVFFAERILELPSDSLIVALLLTQFIAFPAALLLGWIGKVTSPKAGIMICLVVYVLVVVYAWRWLETGLDFYFLAAAIGLVQGGVQSLSRSLFARLIPDSKTTEFFGFFNMVGKFSAILGPFLIAIVPFVVPGAENRDGILVLVFLFIVGGILLHLVNVDEGIRAAEEIEEKLTGGSENPGP